MNKEAVLKTIKKVRENNKKRNFTQTFDFIINLKGLNLKNPEHNINDFVVLKFSKGKKSKVCALVDKELVEEAKKICDEVITKDNFSTLDKKAIKKLAVSYDYFIAQANLMPDIAKFFGKVFGPKGKMPNPKAGCVVPPNAQLGNLYEKLQKTVKVQTKNEMSIKCVVGSEDMKDEEIQENIMAVYNYIIHLLPEEEGNVKSVYLKLTMSKPFIVGEKNEQSS
jgi:large subunit ribosomal protein L1